MKFVGSISSIAAGIFTFIFLSVANLSVDGFGSLTGWDLMKDSIDIAGYTLYKIFAIVSIVVACILIILGIMLLLKDLKVLKVKFNLNFFNNIMLTVFCICVVLAFIGDVVMVGKMNEMVSAYSVGIGMWLLLAVSVVTCLLGWLLTRKEK